MRWGVGCYEQLHMVDKIADALGVLREEVMAILRLGASITSAE